MVCESLREICERMGGFLILDCEFGGFEGFADFLLSERGLGGMRRMGGDFQAVFGVDLGVLVGFWGGRGRSGGFGGG